MIKHKGETPSDKRREKKIYSKRQVMKMLSKIRNKIGEVFSKEHTPHNEETEPCNDICNALCEVEGVVIDEQSKVNPSRWSFKTKSQYEKASKKSKVIVLNVKHELLLVWIMLKVVVNVIGGKIYDHPIKIPTV